MKTTRKVQKTENRNIKTLIMKTFAVITSVALFGFIASASENNHPLSNAENLPAIAAMAVDATAAEAVNLPVAYLEVAREENLEVEDWMTNESYFVASVTVAETEGLLQVEDWMLNNENFAPTNFTEESDQALEVESWMLNNENFAPVVVTEESEKALEVEGWMLNPTTWGM